MSTKRAQTRETNRGRDDRPHDTPGTALARLPPGVLGTHTAADAIRVALDTAAQACILATPFTTALPPEGVAIALSGFAVDVAEDTYKVGVVDGVERRALSGATLLRVAAAGGLTWDARLSGRLDDGSDPRYCRWRAVGHLRQPDGSVVTLHREKEVDLRPGSAEIEARREQAERTARKYAKRGTSEAEILAEADEKYRAAVRQIQLHIQSHAESKAQLRVIRAAFALRSSYPVRELERRPLVVTRAVFTGESSDPQVRRDNAAAIRESFLGGRAALYALGPSEPAPPPPALSQGSPPPPVGRGDDLDLDSDEFAVLDEGGEVIARGRGAVEGDREGDREIEEETDRDDDRALDEETDRDDDEEPCFPEFGSNKGLPLSEGSMRDLEWYRRVLAQNVADPEKSRFRAANQRALDAILSEIEYREASR